MVRNFITRGSPPVVHRRLSCYTLIALAGSFWFLAGTLAAAEGESAIPVKDGQKFDARQLANWIDLELVHNWPADTARPAPLADDATFLRRITLDLSGKIPSVAEARAFLADSRTDKRGQRIEKLLSRATFATHFANLWRESIVPGGNSDLQLRTLAEQLEAWLRLKFADNAPYDRMVAELLSPSANSPDAQATGSSGSAAFFAANGRKPENLAASATRMFLGIRLECAQCHDHPFSAWEQEDFWSFAAFYGALDPANQAGGEVPVKLKIPDTDREVTPRFLDGTRPVWKPGDDPPSRLAAWITAPDNPFFARATVNRMWAYLFGRGLVNPVDDLDVSNPPTHPAILDVVSQQFTAHDFDFRYLARAITLTKAYQRSSVTDFGLDDKDDSIAANLASANPTDAVDNYLAMPVRHLSAEQLFDSFVQATGLSGDDGRRQAFLARFANTSAEQISARTSILQALALMNGPLVAEATDLARSRTLTAIVEAPFLDTSARIETLFLAALSRQPDEDEKRQLIAFVEQGGTPDDDARALSDVFWALLNSAEFMLNH